MDLSAIIASICDEADDFLADATKRDEAKTGISEWLAINHPHLPPADRKTATLEALKILDREGFFERNAGADE